MTTRYFVTYDICDAKRLRRVFEIMKGAGEHVQFSVFRCDLTERAREELMLELQDAIQPREDQVLFIELGPSNGPMASRVTSLGRSYSLTTVGPTIV